MKKQDRLQEIVSDIIKCQKPDPMLEKAQLAAEVYNAFLNSTETFQDLGVPLSYLLGGILIDEKFEFFGSRTKVVTDKIFHDKLKELFHSKHNIWNYIIYSR